MHVCNWSLTFSCTTSGERERDGGRGKGAQIGTIKVHDIKRIIVRRMKLVIVNYHIVL
jgi:hypothetical protein